MKNILITGTSRGIGYQLALFFAQKGHQVMALSRNINNTLNQHKNITCISADITKVDDLQKVRKTIETQEKTIDILIHNAGTLLHKPFLKTTTQEFENIYKVNVFAVAELTRLCIPFFAKKSHVVTISSMGGIQGSVKFAGLSAYSSSKGAIITLSELLAEEYKEKGIAFNVLALGAVQTEMLEEAFPGYKAPLSAKEMSEYIADFALTGNKYFNGKVIQVSATTP